MGGKTRGGWMVTRSRAKERRVMGVQKGVPETDLQLTLAFPGAGLLACVIIPGMLVIGDRVPDHIGESGQQDKKV